MTQWFFKTTAYADELLEYDLPPGGEWPERTKTIQRNWIGRSEGAEILFRVDDLDLDIPVFTTRADTLFGATFFVVAPEHPFVEAHASEEAQAYARHAGARRSEDRAAETEKTGVFTGHHATNPVNGERLPIWVADYVLMDYGTGAIMAVPAHDERDREFAETFGLPVVEVIDEDGRLINSERFDGTDRRGRRACDRRVAGGAGARRGHRLVPAARLELLAAALLGLPDPDRLLRRLRRRARCPRTSCRCCCPTSRTTSRRASRRWPPTRSGCTRRVRAAAATRCATRTRWTRSSTRPGTSCATSTRTTTRRRSNAASSTTGCRSPSTSAASTTPPATCSTRASSSRR